MLTRGVVLWRRFRRWIGHPLGWSRVDMCLFLVFLSAAFFTWNTILLTTLASRVDAAFLNLNVLDSALLWMRGALLWYAVLLATGLWLRHRSPQSPLFVHLSMLTFACNLGLAAYLVGPFQSPFWLAMSGVAIIGFLVFEPRPVLLAVAGFLVICLGTTALAWQGVLPYRPLFLGPPEVDGRPIGWWLARSVAGSVFSFGLGLGMAAYLISRWRLREQEFRRLVRADTLTGALNRRHFAELLEHQFAVAREHAQPLACLRIDVDRLAELNATYGRLTGDLVLAEAAGQLQAAARPGDLVARSGGASFAVLLPHTDQAAARELAEQIRGRLAGHRVRVGREQVGATVSIGVAALPDRRVHAPEALVSRADGALQEAQVAGGDRVAVAG